MLPTATLLRCDIFCNVIDNYGDIGVCWRLARQLVAEHGFAVRLWVDELPVFARICPEIEVQLTEQHIAGVEVQRWAGDFQNIAPGDLVIEVFACQLPEAFIESMAHKPLKPVWINLDYLTAEEWVAGCHTLPSPHPQYPLTKYFFFPGFDEKTGGLLREATLCVRRREFSQSASAQEAFWEKLGCTPPTPREMTISLFAYENPVLSDLLTAWARGPSAICCFIPLTHTPPVIEEFAGRSLSAGQTVSSGNLELRLLPFLAQEDYDRLLWSCDLNFVRGEDSFVRAQWSAKPMIWHIYPQNENAHHIKLDAFLERYCAELPNSLVRIVSEMHHAWNTSAGTAECVNRRLPEIWEQFRRALPELGHHAEKWANIQSKQQDLCSSLVRFYRSKL